MPRKRALPLVAICGRPNVGKSTLFNRLTGKARAIVHDQEGITRDRFFGEATWRGRRFRVVDTGGIVENPVDNVTLEMQRQVRAALSEAQVIVFVVDGREELTRVDHEIREELFKYGKPTLLAVNKLDNPTLATRRYDYFELGLGEVYAISSSHGLGMEELSEAVVAALPASAPGELEEPLERPVIKVAIVGKPNVGKSSFVNALLNEPRTIVDSVPGTTRDAIDIDFHWRGKDYLLIDTAGMRKKAGIKEDVEHFSVARSLRAIRRADVCLVMVEAGEGLAEQDKRIIGYAIEHGVAMVLAWTKWDLVENKEHEFKRLDTEIDLKMRHIKFVPYITLSNKSRQRIFKVFELIDEVAMEAEKRISTAEFNRLIEVVKAKHTPPSLKGKHAKILYGTQVGVKPTTFVLFVNQRRLFHFSYLRFIENQIRETHGFGGVPIKIELREEKRESE